MLEWGNNGMQGAFLLQKNANVQEVSAKLNTLFQNNIEGEVKEGCFLQKFSDDYLYGEFNEKAQVSGGAHRVCSNFYMGGNFSTDNFLYKLCEPIYGLCHKKGR